MFPTAIPHIYERKGHEAIGNCAQCYLAEEEKLAFLQKLRDWNCKVSHSDSLNALLRRGKPSVRNYPSEMEFGMQNKPATFILCILHHDVVQRWRDAVHVIGKLNNKKACTVKQELSNLLFISTDATPSVREWKCRQIICEKHKMTVGIPLPPQHGDAKKWLEDLYKADFELLHEDEHAELRISLELLESILCCKIDKAPLPQHIISPPTVSMQFKEEGETIVIKPHICIVCNAACSHIALAGDLEITPKSTHATELKPEKKMDGPMCKIFVYEVENGTSIDVATSLIAVNVSEDNAPSSVFASDRPRRSRKCRVGEGSFPFDEIDMALDGNLAHLRLLLHQQKGKKLLGQRLFLLRMSAPHSYEALDYASNLKSMHEIVFESAPLIEERNDLTDCITLHLVLSYDDSSSGKRRRKLTPEEETEQEALHFSLLEIAYAGWNADNSNGKNVRGPRMKQRRQERGFQGTFLQSADFDLRGSPSNVLNDAESGSQKGEAALIDKVGLRYTARSAVNNETLQDVVEDLTVLQPTQTVHSFPSSIASGINVVVLDENISLHKHNASGEGLDCDGAAISSTSRGIAPDGCTNTPCSTPSQPEHEQQQNSQTQQQINSLRQVMESWSNSIEHRLGQIEARIDCIEHRFGQVEDKNENI